MSRAFHENLCIYNIKLHVFPFSSFSIQISIKTSSWVYEHFHHLLWGSGKLLYMLFLFLSLFCSWKEMKICCICMNVKNGDKLDRYEEQI